MLGRSTRTYKRVEGLPIEADVYACPTSTPRPVVVWIHGGALIFGRRGDVPPWLIDLCAANMFVLVSIDYRLAPETELPEIVADVEDAVRWLRGDGAGAPPVDPQAIATVGESAGGYLALTAGFRAEPRPAAIVSLWGYGELTGSWYTEPSPHPVHHQIVMLEGEARRQVSGPAVADERHRDGDGYAFYQFCRQHGVWAQEVAGWNPHMEAERFTPYQPLQNISAGYPPTLLIHGTDDTDVPHDQSAMMEEELRRHAVEHRLISVDGAEHGLAGAEVRTVRETFAECDSFLRRHLLPGEP